MSQAGAGGPTISGRSSAEEDSRAERLLRAGCGLHMGTQAGRPHQDSQSRSAVRGEPHSPQEAAPGRSLSPDGMLYESHVAPSVPSEREKAYGACVCCHPLHPFPPPQRSALPSGCRPLSTGRIRCKERDLQASSIGVNASSVDSFPCSNCTGPAEPVTCPVRKRGDRSRRSRVTAKGSREWAAGLMAPAACRQVGHRHPS